MMPERFRKNLAALLGAHGSTAELIRKAGVSRQTIDRWLAGENSPDLEQVDAVATAMGKSPIDLLISDAERSDLTLAWRTVIARVGEIDQTQVPAIVAGIHGALAAIKLDQSDRLGKGLDKLGRATKGKR